MGKTMKPLLLIFIFIAGFFTAAHAQTNANNILGKWINNEKDRVLEFVQKGSTYEAIIKQAPDPSLVGQKQITELSFSKSTYNGKLYLPKKGKTFPCTISLNANGTMEITAKAGMMSKSQTWTRVK